MQETEIIEANKKFYSLTASNYDIETRGQKKFKKYLRGLYQNFFEVNQKREVNVLDFGVGTGYASQLLLQLASEYNVRVHLTGIDISSEMIDKAKAKLGNQAKIMLYDGLNLPKFDQKFDLIIFCSVLHHLYDPLPILKELKNYLSSDAQVLITQEPNPIVNRMILSLRTGLRLLPDENTRLAEFHQFMTTGLSPAQLSHLFGRNFEHQVDYTNTVFVDELVSKFGPIVEILTLPLLFLKSKFFCLSYTLILKKST